MNSLGKDGKDQIMKIAFVNSSLDEYGGIEQRMIELGNRLKGRGHEVLYYSWYYDPNSCDQRYKTHIVRQMRLGSLARVLVRSFHKRIGNFAPNFAGIPLSIFTNVPLIIMTVLDCRPDFVYLSAGHSFAGFVTRMQRTRLVCYYVMESLSDGSILRKLMGIFERYTASNSVSFANSEFLASYVKNRLGVQQVEPLYGGGGYVVEFSNYRTRHNENCLLYLARFSPEKFQAHIFLLRVLRSIQRSDVKLILAGGLRKGLEPLLERLRGTIREFGLEDRVELITNVPQHLLLELYSRATIYVDPNVYDYSISIVDALAAGVPAFARNEGGQAEPVSHGETGFLLGADPEEWARRIEVLLANTELLSKMSQRAKERAKDFSWDRGAKILESAMLRYRASVH